MSSEKYVPLADVYSTFTTTPWISRRIKDLSPRSMDEFHPQQPPNGSKELWKSGGEMIADVYSDHSTYTEPPS